jgi:glycine/D-amino acid oxidase-like deaminating enzyme
MKDYTTYRFWLETCGDDLTLRPSLDGWTEVDIAILGAGFTGLWTAYYLLRREPALRQVLVRWFPRLAGIQFTHVWGGPLGLPRDCMPTVSYDRATGIASARGYTGQGVATANLSGRILADLICGVDTPLATLPMVGHQPRPWEPEPLRWLGVRFLQRGLQHVDDQAERTGRPPSGRSLPERLAGHEQ